MFEIETLFFHYAISEHAEADCFFCFTNLMSDIRDFFIKTLDEAESGINGMMIRFMNKIKSVDSKIHSRLVEQDIKPQYFSFRYVISIKYSISAFQSNTGWSNKKGHAALELQIAYFKKTERLFSP